jgi:cobaltochelatase CobS
MEANKKTFGIAETFGIAAPSGMTVVGNASRSRFVPKVDPHYVFRKEILRDVLAWLSQSSGDGLYLSGPTGCGKSSLICQVAARLNLPVQLINAHARLEVTDLVGHFTVVQGSMSFVDGPLVTALKEGSLFLLDELDVLDPATTAGLNTILDGGPLSIPQTGELIDPLPGFCFIATGNTSGAGDRTGLYQGTLRQNLAFMDRFWVVSVPYPDPDLEKMILAKACPSLPGLIRDKMIEVANEIRRLFMGENGEGAAIEVTMSTRSLVRWAQLAVRFSGAPLAYSLDRALTFRAEPGTRESILEIVQRYFGDQVTLSPSKAGRS